MSDAFDASRLAPRPLPVATGWRRWKAPLIGGLVGAACGAAGAAALIALLRSSEAGAPTPSQIGISLVLIAPALWLQTLIHEAGHAAAGLLVGKRAIGFGVGPWRFERGQAGWHARRGGGVAGIGGFALMVPDGERGAGRAADALYLLGGPLANLAMSGAAYALLATQPGLPSWARVALVAFAFAGAIGLVNLVPFRSQGFTSDGMGLWQLARGDAALQLARLHHELLALSFRGVRARDWPATLLARMPHEERLTPQERTGLAVLRLQVALDRGDAAPARAAALEVAQAHAAMPDGMRQGIALMLAAHAVQVERDPALADAWLALSQGGLLDFSASRAWVAAEVALLRGDATQARAQAALARQALPRVHDAATLAMLDDRLARLESRLAPEPCPA